MATLEKLRKRAGVLVAAVIGLALLAFVMGDLFKKNNPGLTRKKMQIAEIDGKNVSIETYQDYVDEIDAIFKIRYGQTLDEEMVQGIYDQAWQMLIEKAVMGDEYKKVGLSVSPVEILDIAQGSDPHPIIRQYFTNPQTGEFNRMAFLQYVQNIDENPNEDEKVYWYFVEKELLRERSQNKYLNLVSKGMYVTSLEAKDDYYKSYKRSDFNFIFEKYTSVADSSIKISKSDLEDYYDSHKNFFKQDASRDIKYVVFNIVPSAEDNKEVQDEITELTPKYTKMDTSEVIDFVNLESDVRYIDINYTQDVLSPVISEFMFNAQIGDVYGPYFENESYKISKLVNIKYVPDSVRARHILLQPSENIPYEQVKLFADSLKNMIETGANFEALASQYSVDGSREEGGDLGWFREGQMVKPFNDACFNGKIGETQIIESQFGVHILQVLNRSENVKKVNVATIEREVKVSDKTYQKLNSQAIKFAGENNTLEKFVGAAKNAGFNVYDATSLGPNTRDIPGLESPRPLIKWAFQAELNQVSDVYEFSDKLVVGALASVKEKGVAPLEDVKEEVEAELRKEKIAEIISEKLANASTGASSLDDVAKKLEKKVYSASNISFNSYNIPSAGMEPKVVAAAVSLDKDVLSAPVEGDYGVFLIQVTNIQQTDKTDFYYEKLRLQNAYQMMANSEVYKSLVESADVDDKRANFY